MEDLLRASSPLPAGAPQHAALNSGGAANGGAAMALAGHPQQHHLQLPQQSSYAQTYEQAGQQLPQVSGAMQFSLGAGAGMLPPMVDMQGLQLQPQFDLSTATAAVAPAAYAHPNGAVLPMLSGAQPAASEPQRSESAADGGGDGGGGGGQTSRRKRGPRPRLFKKHSCQADGCSVDLAPLSFYLQRNHICPVRPLALPRARLRPAAAGARRPCAPAGRAPRWRHGCCPCAPPHPARFAARPGAEVGPACPMSPRARPPA